MFLNSTLLIFREVRKEEGLEVKKREGKGQATDCRGVGTE